MSERMKVLRSWTDGYGCRVLLKHDTKSGYLYLRDESPGREPWGVTFLPQEIEELADLIQQTADANRDNGVHPYQGRTAVIGGMEVKVVE